LTSEHAAALRKTLRRTAARRDRRTHLQWHPLGGSLEAAHGNLYLFKWVFGAEKPLEEINFGVDIDTYTAALAPYLNAENPDLSAFAKRGGKLVMTLGTADSVVPYHASLDYYERVIERFGGLEKVAVVFSFLPRTRPFARRRPRDQSTAESPRSRTRLAGRKHRTARPNGKTRGE